jgi:hypothetical protein
MSHSRISRVAEKRVAGVRLLRTFEVGRERDGGMGEQQVLRLAALAQDDKAGMGQRSRSFDFASLRSALLRMTILGSGGFESHISEARCGAPGDCGALGDSRSFDCVRLRELRSG